MAASCKIDIATKAWFVWTLYPGFESWVEFDTICIQKNSFKLHKNLLKDFYDTVGYKLNCISGRDDVEGTFHIWHIYQDMQRITDTLTIEYLTSDENITLGEFKCKFDESVLSILEHCWPDGTHFFWYPEHIDYTSIRICPSEVTVP